MSKYRITKYKTLYYIEKRTWLFFWQQLCRISYDGAPDFGEDDWALTYPTLEQAQTVVAAIRERQIPKWEVVAEYE